jgi:regulator of protease activity HflC (stomatin/prohibitin superfamily)
MKKKNDYLEEVFAGTQAVQANLNSPQLDFSQIQQVSNPARIQTKVRGWGPWKTVLVPPNAFVVHTRRGHSEPVHCGMGISFRFNPYRDSFLVAPAAMQTIIVNASCISAERQGILVQAYVQWIIDDFSRAYQRLDLSDQRDPMKVTNLQLEQQAEATIKDTVATMTIDEILSDKQPIIKVLTERLRTVAEGSGPDGSKAGLGLKIVTVQIKEAVVSSTSLWENLQRGFRAERTKEARLSELKSELVVQEEESAASLKMEQVKLEREEHMRQLRHQNEAQAFNLEQEESARRAKLESEHAVERAKHEQEIATQSAALRLLELEQAQAMKQKELDYELAELSRRLELRRQELALERDISAEQLQKLFIEKLPEVAAQLPTPDQLKIYGGDGLDGGMLTRLVTDLSELLESWQSRSQSSASNTDPLITGQDT